MAVMLLLLISYNIHYTRPTLSHVIYGVSLLTLANNTSNIEIALTYL